MVLLREIQVCMPLETERNKKVTFFKKIITVKTMQMRVSGTLNEQPLIFASFLKPYTTTQFYG